jgi:hypothetical protein
VIAFAAAPALCFLVIPANAGIQSREAVRLPWMPAFASQAGGDDP